MISDNLFHKPLETYSLNPDDDLLEKLLTLDLELAAKEKRGEAIVGCWAPEQQGAIAYKLSGLTEEGAIVCCNDLREKGENSKILK